MSRSLTSIEALEKAVVARDPRPKLVSFDVFDTLVRRTLPHPEYSKTAAARHLLGLLSDSSRNISLQEVLKKRLEIESKQRELAKLSGLDSECRIDEVFNAWLSHFDLDASPENLDELLQTEVNFELSVAYATPGIADLLQRLQAQNFRLVFTSDTYLRRSMVLQILDRCDIADYFEAGFVSCEKRLAKYSGRLFQSLLEQLSLLPNEVVHVGDRFDADIEAAAKTSVTALHFTDPTTASRHSFCSAVNRLRHRGSFWEGSPWANSSIAGPERLQLLKYDQRFSLGYEYLGPLFVNYIHRLIEDFATKNIELALFNSRDGYLLREVYERLALLEGIGELPPSRYAYLTRKSVYTSSLREFGFRELDMGFHTVNPTVRNMLVRFSLPEDRLHQTIRRAGFSNLDEEIPNPQSSKRLANLICDPEFLQVLSQVREESAASLEIYLSSLGYWNSSAVALVDVGWNGTVQEALDIAFSNQEDAPVIHGYYLALLGNKIMSASEKSHFHGIYHDYRSSQGGTFFARFVEIFETATRAPHATVVGLQRTDSESIVPVFRAHDSEERQAELFDETLIASLQAGVLAYCDDYIRTYPAQVAKPESHSAFILYKLDRLIRYPSKSESRILGSFAHSEGFGQDLVSPGQHKTTRSKTNPEAANPVNTRVLWKEGKLRKTGVPGLNLLLNGYRVVRRRLY